jgi:hypothetical protein
MTKAITEELYLSTAIARKIAKVHGGKIKFDISSH